MTTWTAFFERRAHAGVPQPAAVEGLRRRMQAMRGMHRTEPRRGGLSLPAAAMAAPGAAAAAGTAPGAGRTAADGSARRVQAPQAGRLCATAGALWVTVEGQPDDHVLAPGQSLAVTAGAVLWIGALDAGPAAGWRWRAAAGPVEGAPVRA